MSNYIQSYRTCPVCYQRCVDAPNGVCTVCYSKEKKAYLHEYEWHDKQVDWWPIGTKIDPIVHEGNVRRSIESELEKWNDVSVNGLSAVQVLIDILDDIDDLDNHIWHRRRIHFMKDMVQRLDKGYFPRATKQQITDFAQSAVDFWDGKISRNEADKKSDNMRGILQKRDRGKWEAKDFLLWMMEPQDSFDWMWDCWFSCIHDCIPDSYNDAIWIELIQKHFPNEIKEWVERD